MVQSLFENQDFVWRRLNISSILEVDQLFGDLENGRQAGDNYVGRLI